MTDQSANSRVGLVRVLGPVDATAIIVGGIIGTGIFASPAVIARETGSPELSLLVWLGAGLLALCGGLCYAELAAAIPETGGTYAYLRRAFRTPFIAFCFGWTFFFVDGPGAIAAVASIFTGYLGYFFPVVAAENPTTSRLVAALTILVLSLLNVIGVQTGGHIQRVLTVIKLAALLTLVIVAFNVPSVAAPMHIKAIAGATDRSLLHVVTLALMPALFAYGGWTYTSYIAGELRRPQRDVPLSIVLGLLLVMAVYLLVNFALFRMLPFQQIQQSSHVASDAMRTVMGERGAALTAIAVMVSALGALNAIILSYARIAWAMSKDGHFFQALSRVHPRFHTPILAIGAQALVAVAFAVTGEFEQILGYFSFVEYLFFSLGVAALIVLRIKEPTLHRPVRVWLYPVPPLLFLLGSILYLSTLLTERLHDSLVGVALLLVGVPFYLKWSRRKALNG